jgi:hypothetical protein
MRLCVCVCVCVCVCMYVCDEARILTFYLLLILWTHVSICQWKLLVVFVLWLFKARVSF